MVKHSQTICRLMPTNCFSVFDHFVGLAFKELIRLFLLLVLEPSYTFKMELFAKTVYD